MGILDVVRNVNENISKSVGGGLLNPYTAFNWYDTSNATTTPARTTQNTGMVSKQNVFGVLDNIGEGFNKNVNSTLKVVGGSITKGVTNFATQQLLTAAAIGVVSYYAYKKGWFA